MPLRAADVPLGEILASSHPQLAEQIADPEALFLPLDQRPVTLPRTYSSLGRDYDKLVLRNVAAGLQDLASRPGVASYQDRAVTVSAFAVAEAGDPLEDRMISGAVQTNALLDPKKLPRPRYAYVPRLCATTSVPRRPVRVTKHVTPDTTSIGCVWVLHGGPGWPIRQSWCEANGGGRGIVPAPWAWGHPQAGHRL